MAIVVTALGTVNAKPASDPWTPFSSVTLAVGDYLVLCIATVGTWNIASGNATWNGNAMTEDADAIYSLTCRAHIFSYRCVSAATGNVVIDWGAAPSNGQAATLYKITGLAVAAFDKSATATGDGTSATAGPTATLSQADEVCIGVTAVNDEIDDAHGSFTTGADYISGNEQFDATNGGGDASNIQVHSVAEVVAVTTAQNIADGAHDSVSWAAAIATYKAAAAFQELTASPVSVASSVSVAAIAGSGIANLNAFPVAGISAVQAAAIAGSGFAPLTAAPVAVVSSVQTATVENVAGAQELLASPVSVASSVQQASVAGSGIANLTAQAVVAISAVQTPIIAGSGVANLTAQAVAVASAVQAATVAGSGIAELLALAIPAASAVQTPAIAGSGVANLNASPVAIVSSVRQAIVENVAGVVTLMRGWFK